MINPVAVYKYIISFKVRDTRINKSICLTSRIAPDVMDGFKVLQLLEQTFAMQRSNFIEVFCEEKS